MKRLLEWLMPGPPQKFSRCKLGQAPVSQRVRPKAVTKDEHVDESSFCWFGTDNADSSVFDTGSLRIGKSEEGSALAHKTLEPINDPPCGGEEDCGFDPYNSGRFKSEVRSAASTHCGQFRRCTIFATR